MTVRFPRFPFFVGVVAASVVVACGGKASTIGDEAGAPVAEGGAVADGSTATVLSVAKKLDAARCTGGRTALDGLVAEAPKSCRAHQECVEWVRDNNCGSVPVAKPFPPPGKEARFRELTLQVAEACPDEAKCKWASLGVECRGGVCTPSLSGRVDPTP